MFFKIKIGTFNDIKVWSSQGLKRCKFPDVIHTDRQTDSESQINPYYFPPSTFTLIGGRIAKFALRI